MGVAGTYRTSINKSVVIRVVGRMSKAAVKRASDTTKQRVIENVIADDLINTGALVKSFRVKDVTVDPLHPIMKIYSTDPKAKYPEYGRGPITARPGHALRFKPKGKSFFVFAKHVGPVRPYGFMKKARAAITKRDFLK